MKVEIEDISTTKKKMKVAIPPEIVDREIDKAYLSLKKTVKLRGFRPGKAPLALLQRYFKNQVEEDVVSNLVQDSYPKALDEIEAAPVSQPIIEKGMLEKGKQFSFTACFETKPVIDVRDYFDLELEKEKVEDVTEEDLVKQLKKLQDANATLQEVEGRTVQKGDWVTIDCEGSMQDRAFPGSPFKDLLIEVIYDSFLPGFSNFLIGLKKGAEKTFSFDVPKDNKREDLAGKKLEFTVKLKQLKEKILPVLDDEFAKDLGEYKSLQDLKTELKAALKKQRDQKSEEELKEKVLDILIKKNSFEVPPAMVENQVRNMILDTQRRLEAQGLKIEALSQSVETLSEKYKDTAEKQIRSALILGAIAKKEGIVLDEEDFDKKFQELAKALNKDLLTVKKNFDKKFLEPQIFEEKALDLIMARAKIKEK